MKRLSLPLILSVLAIATPASAQEAEWGRWGNPIVRIITRDASGCIERLADIGDADTDVMVREDVSGAVTYYTSARAWQFTEGKNYDVRLVHDGGSDEPQTITTKALGFRDARGWGGLTLSVAPGRPAGSGAAALYSGAETVPLATFPINHWRHRCAVELGRVDHGSGKPVATRAAFAMARPLITNDDYPAAAIRAGQQGTTNFHITISAKGLVSACEITGSSGSALLDDATCSILSARARFTPALDSDGRPTEDSYRSRLNWQLPEDTPPPPK